MRNERQEALGVELACYVLGVLALGAEREGDVAVTDDQVGVILFGEQLAPDPQGAIHERDRLRILALSHQGGGGVVISLRRAGMALTPHLALDEQAVAV